MTDSLLDIILAGLWESIERHNYSNMIGSKMKRFYHGKITAYKNILHESGFPVSFQWNHNYIHYCRIIVNAERKESINWQYDYKRECLTTIG